MDSDFRKMLEKSSASLRHENALRGVKRATCAHCNGQPYKGVVGEGLTSYVASCPRCFLGSVEVPCSPQETIAAIDREIENLRKRKRRLKAEVARGR